jgi:hypothetical protein
MSAGTRGRLWCGWYHSGDYSIMEPLGRGFSRGRCPDRGSDGTRPGRFVARHGSHRIGKDEPGALGKVLLHVDNQVELIVFYPRQRGPNGSSHRINP